MFFKKSNKTKTKNTKISSQDFSQEKRLYEFKENMKKLSKDTKSAEFLAKQLSRLIKKNT